MSILFKLLIKISKSHVKLFGCKEIHPRKCKSYACMMWIDGVTEKN